MNSNRTGRGGPGRNQGRKPLDANDQTVRVTIAITASELARLAAINPNISAAIRSLIPR